MQQKNLKGAIQLFIWDFVFGDVLDDILDWVYAQTVGFLANFFYFYG